MNQSIYLSCVKESLAARQTKSFPRISPLFATVIAAILLYLALAVFIAPDDAPHLEFLEGGIVTWMSGALLVLSSLFLFSCFLAHPDRRSKGARFWLLAAIGFLYFCIDELFQGHERLGNLINASPVGPTALFRDWNDAIMIGYGLASLIVLLIYLPEVLKHPRVAETLGIAAGLFVAHTAIDTLVVVPNSASYILEESAKLFSVALFALAAFCALVSIKRES